MTMHPDPHAPWARPHRHPAAFAWMVEPPPKRSAVWRTLARDALVSLLVWGAAGMVLLGTLGSLAAVIAYIA